MSFQNEARHRSVLVGAVVPFLPENARWGLRVACRAWHRWIPERAAAPSARVPLTEDQIAAVTASLRSLRLPWSGATERYLTESLRTVPCLDATPAEAADGTSGTAAEQLDGLTQYLGRLYQRAVVAPKTNIGILDTTRVIERLTQARLSRFHTTGAASMQQATNLDTLLHPSQSTRRPQMIVRLDRDAVDTASARAVLDHLRGRVVAAAFSDFVVGHAVTDDGGLRFALCPDTMARDPAAGIPPHTPGTPTPHTPGGVPPAFGTTGAFGT